MKSTERRTGGNMPFPFDLLARRSFLKKAPHVQLDAPGPEPHICNFEQRPFDERN
jgi:hypothetical protein